MSASSLGGGRDSETESLLAEYFGQDKNKNQNRRQKQLAANSSLPDGTGIAMLLANTSFSTPQRSKKKAQSNTKKTSSSTSKKKDLKSRSQVPMSTSASSSSFLTDAFLRADGEIEGPPPASDFLDSFHFVSHMLHRATEVSGAIPSETVEDRTAKHEQIEVLAKNKEMNTVIENMRILSKQFEDIVHSVSSHRKELGRSIRQTHTTYVRLFERMLFVVLKLQRKRDKKNEREVQGYRDQISQLVLQNDLLQAQLLKLGDQNSALVGLNQSLHVDNDRLIEENAKLDKYFKLYHEISQEMKKNAIKMVVEKEELKKQLAAEEEAMTERFRLAEEQWAEERKKMFEELKASKVRRFLRGSEATRTENQHHDDHDDDDDDLQIDSIHSENLRLLQNLLYRLERFLRKNGSSRRRLLR